MKLKECIRTLEDAAADLNLGNVETVKECDELADKLLDVAKYLKELENEI